MVTSPWRERREVWREKRKVRIFGKGKCKLIANCANFWQVKVCSSPILARQWWRHFRLSLSLSLSLYLSLSLSHRKYLTHNIGSASALPIIIVMFNIGWLNQGILCQNYVFQRTVFQITLSIEKKRWRAKSLPCINLQLSWWRSPSRKFFSSMMPTIVVKYS